MSKNEMTIIGPTSTLWKPKNKPDKQIIVMMSGGVDSSVTALLLKNAGWDVLGITMKIPVAENCDVQRSCCGMEAGYVAKDLDIAHYYVDVKKEFYDLVIEPFRQFYLQGKTPSPCVDCNTQIKFRVVWDFLESYFGIKNLATGHYARIIREGGAYLARGTDKSRDQSYFLYGIKREKLPFLYFPLEEYSKDEVRKMASDAKLPVARKQDSMELCFAGEGDYRNALGNVQSLPGKIIDTDGNMLGEHTGIPNYTVGQRKGLGIAAKHPLFVLKVDVGNNTIIVGKYEEAYGSKVSAYDVNILIPELLYPENKLYGKIRSQGELNECIIKSVSEDKIEVEFIEPQFGITPGQRLVLYDDREYVVCGGIIV